MTYINPFFLFRPFIDKNKKTEDQLLQLRKKILAEIALSPDGYIIAEGQEFTKDDAIKYFESLKNPTEFLFYGLIAKDSILHDFLSGVYPLKSLAFSDEPEYESEAFTRFISPYFKEAYTNYIISLFKEKDNYDNFILNVGMYMTTEDKIESYSEISRFLSRNNQRIGLINKHIRSGQPVSDFRNEILQLTGEAYIRQLNLLPADFDDIRDNYAVEATNLGVSIQNKNRSLAKKIFTSIVNVSCNPDLTGVLERNFKIFDDGGGSIILKSFWRLFYICILIGIISQVPKMFRKSDRQGNRYKGLDNYYNSTLGERSLVKNDTITLWQDINTTRMLIDLMQCYENYHSGTQTVNAIADQPSTIKMDEQLEDLRMDKKIGIKYHADSISYYTPESYLITNLTSYEVILFYTEANYIKSTRIEPRYSKPMKFYDNNFLCFYIGKDIDESHYITFMGNKINGLFRNTDKNTLALLKNKYKVEYHSTSGYTSIISLHERDGVVSISNN